MRIQLIVGMLRGNIEIYFPFIFLFEQLIAIFWRVRYLWSLRHTLQDHRHNWTWPCMTMLQKWRSIIYLTEIFNLKLSVQVFKYIRFDLFEFKTLWYHSQNTIRHDDKIHRQLDKWGRHIFIKSYKYINMPPTYRAGDATGGASKFEPTCIYASVASSTI